MTDIATFKQVMGSFPSGLVIATTRDECGKAWGFTASSFSSVSLDPPLVLFCPARTAASHDAFAAAESFAINILSSEDELVARRFATPGAAKFACDDVIEGANGLPLIRNALAHLVCGRFANYDGGDHSIIVGRVMSASLRAGEALVYYRRNYWQFASSLACPQMAASADVEESAVARLMKRLEQPCRS